MKWKRLQSHPEFRCNLCYKPFSEGGFVYEESIEEIPNSTFMLTACTIICARKIEKHPGLKSYIKDGKKRAIKAHESRDIREDEKAKEAFESILKDAAENTGLKLVSIKDN